MKTSHYAIHVRKPVKLLLIADCFVGLLYLLWWFNPHNIGNPYLYGLLLFGELYHIAMSFLFWLTIWPIRRTQQVVSLPSRSHPAVDIFITVANEPIAIIKETALAAKRQLYTNKQVYILNDGYVAHRPNWLEVEDMAQSIGVHCITRKEPGGAKAGNINNALQITDGEIVTIFDADMVPLPQFLNRVVPYFSNPRLAFVQTPQYYSNHNQNEVTGTSWEQQELFYGPIMRGKDAYNSAFICGTNVAIRRSALQNIGGMIEDSVTEDFLTSMKIHQRGYVSRYLTEVLATGLAPLDLLSYVKQQRRWARGSLEALFGQNPIFKKGLSLNQKLQYFGSGLYYINGFVVLIDILMPLIFLVFGIKPVTASTINFALFFIPFIFLNLVTLYLASGKNITFRAFAFSHASFILQLSALVSLLIGRKDVFAITSKKKLSGNFAYLAYPHIFYISCAIVAIIFAITREGLNPSVLTNIAWTFFNIVMFIPFISAAFPEKERAQAQGNVHSVVASHV